MVSLRVEVSLIRHAGGKAREGAAWLGGLGPETDDDCAGTDTLQMQTAGLETQGLGRSRSGCTLPTESMARKVRPG